jgi:hypothetical protein
MRPKSPFPKIVTPADRTLCSSATPTLESHSNEFVPVALPSLPRLAFALACDALLFYLLGCVWTAVARRRRVAGQAAG